MKISLVDVWAERMESKRRTKRPRRLAFRTTRKKLERGL
jgi:hypothetical protein